jgi:hypothetical protein
MTDNVPITAGVGTNVATDDVSGAHYQRVKLVDGTDGGTTPAVIDANGLLVALNEVSVSLKALLQSQTNKTELTPLGQMRIDPAATLTTVTTVTTVSNLTNLTSVYYPSSALLVEGTTAAWAAAVRSRIT